MGFHINSESLSVRLLVTVLLLSVFFSSCTVVKRRYNPGYYIRLNQSMPTIGQKESIPETSSINTSNTIIVANSDAPLHIERPKKNVISVPFHNNPSGGKKSIPKAISKSKPVKKIVEQSRSIKQLENNYRLEAKYFPDNPVREVFYAMFVIGLGLIVLTLFLGLVSYFLILFGASLTVFDAVLQVVFIIGLILFVIGGIYVWISRKLGFD